MVEENSRDKSKQDPQQRPEVAPPPVADAVPVIEPVKALTGNIDRTPVTEPAQGKPRQPRKILIEIAKDGEMTSFERNSLDIASSQLDFTKGAVLVAIIASVFVYLQIKEMTYNNQILASQSESATAASIADEINTRKQIGIAQQQASAAQQSVTAIQRQMRTDQRPWMRLTLDFSPMEVAHAVLAGRANILNFGKTPAKRVFSLFYVEKVENGKVPTFKPTKQVAGFSAGTIFPNLPPPQEGFRPYYFLTPEEGKAFGKGTVFFVVFGTVTYEDFFHVKHWTKFCQYEASATGGPYTAEKCTSYNDVDNN